jgi:transposase
MAPDCAVPRRDPARIWPSVREPVLETSVTTDPDTIFAALRKYVRSLRRVGHEARSLSPLAAGELKQRGLAAICLEAWHGRVSLSAMRNKTDEADARGIAHIVRTG